MASHTGRLIVLAIALSYLAAAALSCSIGGTIIGLGVVYAIAAPFFAGGRFDPYYPEF